MKFLWARFNHGLSSVLNLLHPGTEERNTDNFTLWFCKNCSIFGSESQEMFLNISFLCFLIFLQYCDNAPQDFLSLIHCQKPTQFI